MFGKGMSSIVLHGVGSTFLPSARMTYIRLHQLVVPQIFGARGVRKRIRGCRRALGIEVHPQMFNIRRREP